MLQLDLTGKTALVCGSSQGIGKASAIELADLGARIILLARNEEELKKTKEELPTPKNQDHAYLLADFSQAEVLAQNLDALLQDFGTIHILVNNTGGPPPGPAHTATLDAFESAFRQHLICNQILVQAVLEGMKSEKYGRIINIISTSVKQPIPNLGVSNTVRAAVANWAKTLAMELGPFGITVNNVLPGATGTARLDAIIENKHIKTSLPKEEVAKEMMSEIPMRRFAKPSEIGSAVAFLASPAAGYINGINLPVDGGRTSCL